jgi:predicted secreted protein
MPAGNVFSGKDMSFKTGSTPAVEVHTGKWELTITGNVGKYASNSTGGWRKSVKGVKEWSGTVTVMLHDGEAMPFVVDDEVAAQFLVDASNYISGTVLITEVGSITVDADSGDPIAIDYKFDGQGAPASSGTAMDVV